MLLTILIADYFCDRDDLRPKTVEQYTYLLGMFCDCVGDVESGDITRGDIRRFLRSLTQERGLSRRTATHAHTALSSLFRWANREHGHENVMLTVDRPKFVRQPPEYYTAEQIESMIRACSHTNFQRNGKRSRMKRHTALRDVAIIKLLIDTGLRASELCNLVVADYDQIDGRVSVRGGKGGKNRAVYAGKRCRRAIARYLASRSDAVDGEPLFAAGEFNRQHIERNNLLKLLQRIGQRAGVTGVTVHRFRHTFAVMFLRAGGSALHLQRALGHSDMKTVLEYVRLAETDLEQAARDYSPADRLRV